MMERASMRKKRTRTVHWVLASPSTRHSVCMVHLSVPLCFQFSGTVFYEGPDGALQVAPISWDKEAKFRLPLRVWKGLMDAYYPNSAWLSLHKDTFEKLYLFKVRESIPTWDEAIERALAAVSETVRS